MKQDEMTICQCVEYLDSMVGDDENIKGCLDYIERKAKAMDKKLRDYKNIFEEEKPEIKQESNFEHFENEIRDAGFAIAVKNGEVIPCGCCSCEECLFFGSYLSCRTLTIEWLYKKYQRKYKLTQFEYDLIKTFDHCKECCLLNEIECLKKLREKGYFNGIDPFTKVHEILDNCEVIQ